MAPFGDLMSGHLGVLGEQLLAYSTGNPFMLLSRATRDAVPRGTIDASLPGKLDAALARNDETAARRLAGEAMRRVARNVRTLNQRLDAMGYPVQHFCPRTGRAYGRAVDDYDALVAATRDVVIDMRDGEPVEERRVDPLETEEFRGALVISYPVHIPLMLDEFWRWVGGCSLMDPTHYSHPEWWKREHEDIISVNKRVRWVENCRNFGFDMRGTSRDERMAYGWDECGSQYADPLHLDHAAGHLMKRVFKTNSRGNPVVWLAADEVRKDNYSGGAPYRIEMAPDAGLDPLISDFDPFPRGMHPEFAEALERNEDLLRPDIEDVLTQTWLSENPGLTSEDIALKIRKFNSSKEDWLMTLPGPGDRGPLTLLEYLRLALLVHGGFTGLNAANPNFDPLRRALIADLEPF